MSTPLPSLGKRCVVRSSLDLSLSLALSVALTVAIALSAHAAHAAQSPTPMAPCVAEQTPPTSAYFSNWPKDTDPIKVGERITKNFLAREILIKKTSGHIVYPEAVAWYGALTWAKLAHDFTLRDALINRFEPIFDANCAAKISPKAHVDDRVFGIVPLEIYNQTADSRLLGIGRSLADQQWDAPDAAGLSAESRFWIDDMYMIPMLQMEAWRATQDDKYLDRAALTAKAYLERLQQPSGLFLHTEDSPFYWGRGNGWFAAGLTEILSDLPEDHPQYAPVMAGYKKMMAALLANQDKSGLWRQLLDQPESWTETSGSAMFTFAFVTGVKKGWLPATEYGPAARRAWLALVASLDAEGNLTEICVGTNKAFKEVGSDLEKQKAFYLARPRKAGDRHGQAPMLWTASALLR